MTALRSALIVLAVLLAGAACGGENDGPSATTGSSPTAQPELAPLERKTDSELKVINPGTYRPELFAPSLTFTVPESWGVFSSAESFLHLFYYKDDIDGHLYVTRPDAVYEPPRDNGQAYVNRQLALPPDLTEWLQTHPTLNTSKASSLQINDIAARQMEAAVREGADLGDTFTLPLFQAGEEYFDLGAAWLYHLIVVDHPSGEVVIIIGAEAAHYRAFFTAAEPVIGSLTLAR